MNYKIKSLGYRTDFIFNRLDGFVIDRGEYIVAATASNPHFFWGNLLLYKRPPQFGDLAQWRNDFKREFPNPEIYHMTFAWDSPEGIEGETREFIDAGFKLDNAIVLSSKNVHLPPKYNSSLVVREVDLATELNRCVEIQVASADDQLSKASWKGFYTKSMHNYLDLIQQGHGKWFGAYKDLVLVGTLGVFHEGSVGRFQIVSTHPDHQRIGVCSTLVYEAGQYALEKMQCTELVMVADEEYHAAKIYESVGFKPTQKQAGLCWWDKSKHS